MERLSWALAAAPVVAVLVLLAALVTAGDLRPLPVGDPGPVVRVGLPAAALLRNLAAATVLGALTATVWVLGPADRRGFERMRATLLQSLSGA